MRWLRAGWAALLAGLLVGAVIAGVAKFLLHVHP